MRRPPSRSLCWLAVALFSVIASQVGAQASSAAQLRVLRFLPEGVAGPSDSLVIAFDHPVAPALDRSVDPGGVVRLEPSVPTKAYWRDPSTIVVRFTEPLAFGTRYAVTLAPTLRGADGARISEGERELRVRKPQLLLVYPSGGRTRPDSLQRPFAVYEGAVPLDYLSGRLVGSGGACRSRSIAMHADSIRPILPTDPDEVRKAGGPFADRRLEGLRRVVRFSAKAPIPEGCLVMARVSGEPGGADHEAGPFVVASRFTVASVGCSSTPCEDGNVVVTFSHPVRGSEVETHVRVNGVAASVERWGAGRDGTSASWQLQQKLRPGKESLVSIDGTIVDALGRSLGADVRRTLKGDHLKPSVELITGPVIVPRDAAMLFALRHTNTDSITIVIGRVADSLRAPLLHAPWYYYHEDQQPRMEPDSIVRIVAPHGPADSAATFVVPASWIPRAWRDEPLLLLRASPTHVAPGYRYFQSLRTPRSSERVLPPTCSAVRGHSTCGSPRSTMPSRWPARGSAFSTAASASWRPAPPTSMGEDISASRRPPTRTGSDARCSR